MGCRINKCAPNSRTGTQAEAKRDPRGAVENQINANKKTYYPEPRSGPLRQNK
jgi:hypothetical protein